MTENRPEPPPRKPTSKELRDARRQAYAAQKKTAGTGSDKMGKKGKGDRKP